MRDTAFYKWNEHDFRTIPAYELQVGDEISYPGGPHLTYGALPIEDLSIVPGGGILLRCDLRVGVLAADRTKIDAMVMWEEEHILIQIHQHLKYTDRVLIRRK